MSKLYEYSTIEKKITAPVPQSVFDSFEKNRTDLGLSQKAYITEAVALLNYFVENRNAKNGDDVVELMEKMTSDNTINDILSELSALKGSINKLETSSKDSIFAQEQNTNLLKSLSGEITETHRVATRFSVHALKAAITASNVASLAFSVSSQALGSNEKDADNGGKKALAISSSYASKQLLNIAKDFLTEREIEKLGI